MGNASPPDPWKSRRSIAACCGLVGVFAVLSYTAALRKSATYDEPFHALAGWLKLHRGDLRMDYESLPLATGWSALANPGDAIRFDSTDQNWAKIPQDPYPGFELATRTLYRTPGNDGAAFINRARGMMLVLGVGLGALVIGWSWKIGGGLAGIVAAVVYSLDPNMLGHASLVKTDIAVSLAMAGAVFLIWVMGRGVTVGNALMFWGVMGVGMNTKFSAMLLWPMAGVLLGARAMMGAKWVVLGRTLSRVRDKALAAIALFLGAGLMTVLVTWAAHGFRFGPSPDPSITISREAYRYELMLDRYRDSLSGIALSIDPEALRRSVEVTQKALNDASIPPETRLRLQGSIDQAKALLSEGNQNAAAAAFRLGFVQYFITQPADSPDRMVAFGEFLLEHRLMPSAWVNGLMVQYSRSNILDSYLLGRVRSSGVWYFFPLAMLVKTPVAEVIAIGFGAVYGLWMIRSHWESRSRWGWTAICVLVPPIVFMGMAMASNLNIGLRHIFPVYPFMFVAAAVAIASALARGGPGLRRVAVGVGVILLAETAFAWPNYIAHFNVIARTWPGELELLGDSNLDWGQDLPALKKWRDEHPGKPLALAYFGTASPEFYGIEYEPLPPWPPPADLLRTHVLAVSATYLQGMTDARFTGYRQLTPGEVLGGTIYLYYDRPPAR